jgi:hypothetical protein
MKRIQDIWIGQCAAARNVLEQHGPLSAMDYLIGEKLMTYVATAEDHPEFARELPKFVVEVCTIFGTEAIGTYVEHMEKVYREGEEAAQHAQATGDEDGPFDHPDEWRTEGRRLAQLKDLLTTTRLGTA